MLQRKVKMSISDQFSKAEVRLESFDKPMGWIHMVQVSDEEEKTAALRGCLLLFR